MRRSWNIARRVDVWSACVDICQSHWRMLLYVAKFCFYALFQGNIDRIMRAHLPNWGLKPVCKVDKPLVLCRVASARGETYRYFPGRSSSQPSGHCQFILLGDRGNYIAVLCGMPTIQYSTRSARLYLIRGSFGPPESSTQTASRSLQPFLQGSLVWQTDRQTNRPRYSVGNNRRQLLT